MPKYACIAILDFGASCLIQFDQRIVKALEYGTSGFNDQYIDDEDAKDAGDEHLVQ